MKQITNLQLNSKFDSKLWSQLSPQLYSQLKKVQVNEIKIETKRKNMLHYVITYIKLVLATLLNNKRRKS